MPRRREPKPEFQIVKIPKGNGRFRTIYMPRADIKQRLKNYVPALERTALEVCPPNVVHGFWPARSCVSNAAMHVGYEYTVCMDLTDFFDHCTLDAMMPHIIRSQKGWGITTYAKEYIAPDGACRPGLPTSPAAANICASEMDWALVGLVHDEWGVQYTRYADDLTFSCDDFDTVKRLLESVPEIVASHGFKVNERKTRVQCARAGRRIITGVAVDDTGVYPTRKAKRKLRAARHKVTLKPNNPHWKHRAAGLAEWCKCKRPGIGKKTRKEIEQNPDDALQLAAAATRYAVSTKKEE